MGVITLRPTGAGAFSNVTLSSGGIATDLLSDNSDASWVQYNTGAVTRTLDMFLTDMAGLPTNAQIRYVQARVRHDLNSTSYAAYESWRIGSADGRWVVGGQLPNAAGAIATQACDAQLVHPSGAAWTDVLINDLKLQLKRLPASTAPAWKVYEAYVDVIYNEIPVVSAVLPTANQTTTRPAISWTYTDPEGDAQERFRVRIFTEAQYNAAGFDAATATPFHDSGEIYSAAPTYTPTVDLTNGVRFAAFVQVCDAGSGGRYSLISGSTAWSAFNVVLVPPAVPSIAAAVEESNRRHALTLTDRQSLLNEGQFSFETGLGDTGFSWFAVTNCTLLQVASGNSEQGGNILRMSATALGDMVATSGFAGGTAEGASTIVAGQVYTARVASGFAITLRSVRADIEWYQANGTYISTTLGVAVTEVASTWIPALCQGTAPALAARAKIVVNVIGAAAAELHYLDAATFVPGAINLVHNPIFEADTNLDGVADDWAGYSFPGGDALPVASRISSAWAGDWAQRSTWAVNTGWKGFNTAAGIHVKAGQAYKISAVVRSPVVTTVVLHHPNESAAHTGTVIPANTWTRISRTMTALTTGVSSLYVRTAIAGAGTLDVGHVQMELGSTMSAEVYNRRPYVPGGLRSLARFEVQRSTDGGTTWATLDRLEWQTGRLDYTTVNYSDASQVLGVYDYEAPRGVSLTYRTRVKVTAGNSTVVSAWSNRVTVAAVSTAAGALIKDPIAPSRNVAVTLDQRSIDKVRSEPQGVHYAVGRTDPIVVHGTVRKSTFPLRLFFAADAAYAQWLTLQDSRRTLLLQTCFGDTGGPEQYYFTIDPDVQTEVLTVDGMGQAQPRRVTLTARETVSP